MNAYIKLMDELVYFLWTGGSLQTSTCPFVDCSSLGPLFYKRLQNGDILVLFFLKLFIKNFLSSTKWLLVTELIVERQNACLIPSLTFISFVHSFLQVLLTQDYFQQSIVQAHATVERARLERRLGLWSIIVASWKIVCVLNNWN